MENNKLKVTRKIDYILSAIVVLALMPLFLNINPNFKALYSNILLLIAGMSLITLGYINYRYNLNIWANANYFKTKKSRNISIIISIISGTIFLIFSLIGFFFGA